MLAAQSVPAVSQPSEALDDAHTALVLSSAELAEMCQENLTDTGLARIARLVEMVNVDLARTLKAKRESVMT